MVSKALAEAIAKIGGKPITRDDKGYCYHCRDPFQPGQKFRLATVRGKAVKLHTHKCVERFEDE